MASVSGQLVVALVVSLLVFGFAFLVGLKLWIAAVLCVAVLSMALLVQVFRRNAKAPTTKAVRTLAVNYAVAGLGTFVLMQLVPYGRAHTNNAVSGEPQWANTETRDLMVRGCFGCHSNQVTWPWYSNIAPMSWAITGHVDDGRAAVNYSEFDKPQDEADETIEEILDGKMPPAYYTRFGLHAEANFTEQEQSALIDGLQATPGMGEGDEDEDEEEEDDD